MPDSPKCRECLRSGVLSQTYKIAGSPRYKCNVCKKVSKSSEFEDAEFRWKDDPKSWDALIKRKFPEPVMELALRHLTKKRGR